MTTIDKFADELSQVLVISIARNTLGSITMQKYVSITDRNTQKYVSITDRNTVGVSITKNESKALPYYDFI